MNSIETTLEKLMTIYGEDENLPSREQWRQLLEIDNVQPVMILNMMTVEKGEVSCETLGFKGSGLEAQARYVDICMPIVQRLGIERHYVGQLAFNIIGPEALDWDSVGLVKYPSRDAFLEAHLDPLYCEEALPYRRLFMKNHRMIFSTLSPAA